jgi:hypothetical protein
LRTVSTKALNSAKPFGSFIADVLPSRSGLIGCMTMRGCMSLIQKYSLPS